MKRVLFAAGVALALGAAPMAGQTRVSVAVGFGLPRPFVTGVVIVGRPHVYSVRRRSMYRPPMLVVRRVLVVRHHRHHLRHHYEYDDDDD